MSSSVSANAPYSYYNVLNPNSPLTIPTAASSTAPSSTGTSSNTSTTSAPTGSGDVPLPADVLSLLQQVTSGSGSSASSVLNSSPASELNQLLGISSGTGGGGIDSLLGGLTGTETNPLAGTPEASLLSQDYAQVIDAAYAGAATTAADQAAASNNNPVQEALAAYQAALAAAHPNITSTST